MAERRETKKDVFLTLNDSRALHWKKAWAKENEEEEEIFPGLGLAWDVVVETTGAIEGPHWISLRTFRPRIAVATTRHGEGSSSAAMIEVLPKLSGVEDAYEDNRDIDYDTLSDNKLDIEDIQYEDDK